MTMPLALLAIMVVLFACGVYLLLDRSLTRVLLGFLLVGNATNLLLFLTSGSFGAAPIYGDAEAGEMSDPLPQAFILTSIVITFGVSAFMLALIYRSWRLAHDRDDTVQDDEADLEIATTTEALTTEEVTDEDLAETQEFDDESSADDSADEASDESSDDADPSEADPSGGGRPIASAGTGEGAGKDQNPEAAR